MNISQIEQALRNLIASQPMVSTGPSGEVIGSIANIIDAFKDLNYRTQTYSSQDSLKFALQNDCAKIENDICTFAVSVLQERGINILLYLPAQNSPYSAYGFGAGANQGYVPGQMVYSPNAQMMGQSQMFAGGFYGQGNMVTNQVPNSQPKQVENQNFVTTKTKAMNQSENETAEQNVFEQAVSEPSFDELEASKQKFEETENPVAQTTKKQSEKQSAETTKKVEETANLKPIKTGIKPAGSSNGRDYLLELLKK